MVLLTGICLKAQDSAKNNESDTIIYAHDLAEALKLPVNDTIKLRNDGQSIDWSQDRARFDILNENIEVIVGKEKFKGFFYNFAVNPYFQRDRIHFPLRIIKVVDSLDARNNFYIKKENFSNTIVNSFIGLYIKTNELIDEYSLRHDKIVFSSISFQKIQDLYFVRQKGKWVMAGKVVRYPDLEHMEPVDANFENFFYRFITDFDFQKERIKYPYQFYVHNIENETVDTLNIVRDNYEKTHFNHPEYFIIYNNFQKELDKTDEIFLRYEYNDYSKNQGFNFRRIDGKWYLVDGWDASS